MRKLADSDFTVLSAEDIDMLADLASLPSLPMSAQEYAYWCDVDDSEMED